MRRSKALDIIAPAAMKPGKKIRLCFLQLEVNRIPRSSSIAFLATPRVTSSGMCIGAMRVRAVFEVRERSFGHLYKKPLHGVLAVLTKGVIIYTKYIW